MKLWILSLRRINVSIYYFADQPLLPLILSMRRLRRISEVMMTMLLPTRTRRSSRARRAHRSDSQLKVVKSRRLVGSDLKEPNAFKHNLLLLNAVFPSQGVAHAVMEKI